MIQLDTREFEQALRDYEKATQKDMADILNRAARNVAYRAAQNTPVANKAEIKSYLFRDEKLRYALTSIALRKKGVGVLKSPQFKKAVERFVAHRLGSSRYLRAMWKPAIEKFGGTFRGAAPKGGNEGYGIKAVDNIAEIFAEIGAIISQPDEKHAAGAEDIGLKALQDAVDFVAEDLLEYAEKKMRETAKKHSS
jgi:hypothetical protein